MIITPGMLIGDRYEIIEKIGTGGMADVYKAKCHRLNRMVAIKFLKPEYSSDNSFVSRFRGEAESCAGLTHPNVVSVYDVGDEGDLHYIVMELVEGITLKRYIEKKGQLEIKEAVGIAIQIAQGLDAAHTKHVIHRDIKPQNIILSREGKVKVADFGIAKAATTTNTIQECAAGSVHYLSPEQARGYSDERSDIYSLGITMYEMLAGRVPYAGDNNVSVALAHISESATPLIELNPAVTPAVEKIVRKCMSKKPERRYATAADLIADLKAALANPDGQYVMLAPAVTPDAPTKQLSDSEVRQIKSGARSSFFDEDGDGDDEDEDPKKAAAMISRHRIDDDEEDDDIDNVGSIWEKVGLVSSIVLMVAIAVIVILAVNKMTGIFDKTNKGNTLKPKKQVTATATPTTVARKAQMPNLVGQKYQAASQKLNALGLKLSISVIAESAPSDKYAADTVTRHEPLQDAELSEGDVVVLYYSIGRGDITMPKVKGRDIETAKKILDENFSVIAIPEASDLDEGIVIRSEPVENTKTERGSTVTVYYSIGPEMITVPNTIGDSLANAEKKLTDLGLKFEIKEEYAVNEAGTVYNQMPSQGVEMKKGSTVTLYVSKGPEPTPTPTPTPIPTNTPSPTPVENQNQGENNNGNTGDGGNTNNDDTN
ncbi:MAG: Stk1 family PASTA domain-containing Ser/Thr kinase [Lachnospiraceae bacterium]|nr:Stk1 family PASTA domain-containing Ser/Thr kinase [Lachnospiraceae bacterium]